MIARSLLLLLTTISLLDRSLAESQAPAFDLWMSLAERVKDRRPGKNDTSCEQAIANIVEHLQNLTFEAEALTAVDNTKLPGATSSTWTPQLDPDHSV